MIKRKITQYLEQFFKESTKALLVTGARQTGKTFAIRHYGSTHYAHFVEINFVDNPRAKNIFSRSHGAQELLLRLSAFASQRLVKGETLIFLDEVQECPEVVTAIKFLVDEGSYRYVLSGSLLGTIVGDIRSVPVGYMDIKEMYPLDFEEFVRAMGVSDEVMSALHTAYDSCSPVDAFVHGKMMELFRLYLVVGGMPAVVDRYLQTNNLQAVLEEQQGILRLYKKDIAKYDRGNKLYIEEIFDLIPPELNAKNKRFILKNLNENLKFSRYENSFLWLKDAGVALPVYNVTEPVVPLLLSRSRNLFKLFQNDIGLLACQYAAGIQLRILMGDSAINYGAIYENAVAQELHAHGYNLYYYNNKRLGELDFVIEHEGSVLPIEVKSGKDYERHRALSSVVAIPQYDISKVVVLCNDYVRRDSAVTYLPIYMTMFIAPAPLPSTPYRIDLTGLTQSGH